MRAAVLIAVLVLAAGAGGHAQEAEDGPGGGAPRPSEALPSPAQAPQAPQGPQAAPPFPAAPPSQPAGFIEQRRWGLFATGVGIFGGAWVGNVIGALNAEQYLGMIPLAGPFLIYDRSNGTGTNVLLILDGLAQNAGATVAILGLVLKKRIPVYAVIPTGAGLAVTGLW